MDNHPSDILKTYWGYDAFRPMQEEIINAVLDGKDVLALLPTGGGKSVCFQVPAMVMEGICLVVSPLIALMKDQVEQLRRRDIPALAIYSGMSFTEVRNTLREAISGRCKFLYVSPERLETSLFLEFLPSLPVNLLAVDEAHCISQWGYDFRPPYVRIAAIREQLPGIPVLALTASATREVQDDICTKLHFGKQQERFQQSFERPNLSYSVFNTPSKPNKLLEILNNVPGSSIVYCKSRKLAQETARLLGMHGISADHYHAGLNNEERSRRQESWINNNTRVIVCTNAFGMGIDKPDVRTVVHYDIPDCLENYYQEAGRAGRDGKRSYAVLLYQPQDIDTLKEQSAVRFPDTDTLKKIYTALMNHLQVPAGSGERRSIDFDMSAFCEAFGLSPFSTGYAIKTLEQEGLFSYNEMFFKPSTLLFTSNRQELNELEQQFPQLDPLVKGLLRSYEGILDYPVMIFEQRLAGFVRKDTDWVKQGLKKLHELGVVAYTPQKDRPQLYLIRNRMYADTYTIDTAAYLQRKQKFEERVAAMIGYITDTDTCRSGHIARYFTGELVPACGICDNCLARKDKQPGAAEFRELAERLLAILQQQPANMDTLLRLLRSVSREKIWRTIDYLVAEKKVEADKEGVIRIL